MARVKNNMITTGIAGKVGDIIYRTHNGRTHCYYLTPATPNSQAQKASQSLFAKAVKMSQQDKLDEDYMAEVKKVAKRKRKRPFDVLMSRNMRKLRESQ